MARRQGSAAVATGSRRRPPVRAQVSRTAAPVIAIVLAIAACSRPAEDPAEPTVARITGEPGAGYVFPRKLLFGAPERIRARLSPDGSRASWLAMHVGALNVFVAQVDAPGAARPVTAEGTDVLDYAWARNATHILFTAPEVAGDRVRRRVIAVDVVSGARFDLTPPGDGVSARILASSWDFPDHVVLTVTAADDAPPDVYRVDLATGGQELIYRNAEGFSDFVFDNRLRLRLALFRTPEGGLTVHRRHAGAWTEIVALSPREASGFQIIGFDGADSTVYALDSRELGAAALVRLDPRSGRTTMIAGAAGRDVAEVLLHPTTATPDAIATDWLAQEWSALTSRAAAAFAALAPALDAVTVVLSRTVDDRRWIVFTGGPSHPGHYLVFEPDTGAYRHLLDIQPALSAQPLAPMTPVVIPSGGGGSLVAHLTLPPGADLDGDGRPERTSPLVVLPAIGPTPSTQRLMYDANVQWLADRGYATLVVATRGARGFGAAHRSGAGQPLGPAIADDLAAAIGWATERGVADPARIAVLANAEAAGVALRAPGPAAAPVRCVVAHEPPAAPPAVPDRPAIVFVSAPRADTVAAFASLARGPAPLTVIAHPDFVARSLSQSTIAIGLQAAAEAFLAQCLGGGLEPIAADVSAAGPLEVVGAERVPGLAEALAGAAE